MANQLRVMLEIGPKGKKVVAMAPEWRGLERGAKTEEAALERFQSYFPRYARVAKLAGMDAACAADTTIEVVERWGINRDTAGDRPGPRLLRLHAGRSGPNDVVPAGGRPRSGHDVHGITNG